MRKTIIILVNIFLAAQFGFSQENGVVTYTVVHDWTKKFATCEYIPKADRDRQAYAWGGRTYEQKAELMFNPEEYRFEYQQESEASTYQWRKEDYIIFRDRRNEETFDVMTLLDKEYVIKDSLVCQNWKIKNDMKEIANHICMNATYYDSIRGKEVIAWFALDLPVSLGPNKYCGLPGMILEVNEADGALVYTATSVIISEEKVEIEKPVVKKKRKIIHNKDYNDIVVKYINECKKMQRPYFWGMSF